MKKSWKITIAVTVAVVVTAVAVGVAAEKKDKRREALKGMQYFFEVSEESMMNQYLDYCSFEELFYKKDMQMSAEMYADIGKLTVKAELEGAVDKSNRIMKASGNVGLGGMPFAQMVLYSDDTNLYLASDLFEDKLLKLDYTEDLYDIGSNYGISHRNMMLLQKSYIQLFQMAVSENKYQKLEELLKKKQLKEDLYRIYKSMEVEKQDNTDELVGGYIYQVNFKSEDVKTLLDDLCAEYPEFEKDDYLYIVNKFVSEQKDVEITELVDRDGFTRELSLQNEDTGYELSLKREEEKKQEKSGFESSFSAVLTKYGDGIFNGEMVLVYSAANKKIELSAKEDITGVSVVVSGIIDTDKKKGKIFIDAADIKGQIRNQKFESYGNTEIVFDKCEIEIPQERQIDVIQSEFKELQEVKKEIMHSLKGIAGSALRQFLSSSGA